MQTQPKLQGLEIGQLVKRLADLRGNELKGRDIPRRGNVQQIGSRQSQTRPSTNDAVSYQTTYHPARVLTRNAAPELGTTRDHGRQLDESVSWVVPWTAVPTPQRPGVRAAASKHRRNEGAGPAARLSAEAAAGWTARWPTKKSPDLHGNPSSRHQSVGRRVQHPPAEPMTGILPRLAKPTPERPGSRRPMATLRHERMGNGHTAPQAQR